MSAITDYYDGTGTDHLGRTRASITAPGFDLEPCHDYIQWLFPLPEPSAYFPGAPLLTAADQAAFTSDGKLRAALIDSLDLMLGFYGLPARDTLDPAGAGRPHHPTASRLGSWPRIAQWAMPRNHNLLRLTRILRSLTLLGCETEAQWLMRQLCAVWFRHGERIGAVTLTYWAAATTGHLPHLGEEG